MKRDGRFEPLTVVAQIAALTTVVIVWASHEVKRRFRAVDLAAQAELHKRLTAGLNITGPSNRP